MAFGDQFVPDITEEDQADAQQPAIQLPDAIPADQVKFKYYGPEVGDKPAHDVLYGPTGQHLQPGQVAVSPDLAEKYPLGTPIGIGTKDGKIVHGVVADFSW